MAAQTNIVQYLVYFTALFRLCPCRKSLIWDWDETRLQKRTFSNKRIFTHLNLQREDDLFINQTCNTNTRVETNARAIMRMQPIERDTRTGKKKGKLWLRHVTTKVSNAIWAETCSRLLFYMACIAGIVFGIIHSHWLVAGIAFFIWLLRYTVQAIVINKTQPADQEKTAIITSPRLFDLLQPLQTTQFKLYRLYRGKGDYETLEVLNARNFYQIFYENKILIMTVLLIGLLSCQNQKPAENGSFTTASTIFVMPMQKILPQAMAGEKRYPVMAKLISNTTVSTFSVLKKDISGNWKT